MSADHTIPLWQFLSDEEHKMDQEFQKFLNSHFHLSRHPELLDVIHEIIMRAHLVWALLANILEVSPDATQSLENIREDLELLQRSLSREIEAAAEKGDQL